MYADGYTASLHRSLDKLIYLLRVNKCSPFFNDQLLHLFRYSVKPYCFFKTVTLCNVYNSIDKALLP